MMKKYILQSSLIAILFTVGLQAAEPSAHESKFRFYRDEFGTIHDPQISGPKENLKHKRDMTFVAQAPLTEGIALASAITTHAFIMRRVKISPEATIFSSIIVAGLTGLMRHAIYQNISPQQNNYVRGNLHLEAPRQAYEKAFSIAVFSNMIGKYIGARCGYPKTGFAMGMAMGAGFNYFCNEEYPLAATSGVIAAGMTNAGIEIGIKI